MNILLSLAVLACSTGLIGAVGQSAAQQTTRLVVADAVFPHPTPAPEWNIDTFLGLAKRSQAANTCGFVSGNPKEAVTCGAADVCVFNTVTKNVGCCPSTSTNCHIPFACIPLSRSTAYKSANNHTVFCSESASRYCRTWIYTDTGAFSGFTAVGCGSVPSDTKFVGHTIATTTSASHTSSKSITRTTTHTEPSISSSSIASSSATSTTSAAASPSSPPPTSSPTGAIVGGVVGGIAAVALAILAAVFFVRRRRDGGAAAAAPPQENLINNNNNNNNNSPPPPAGYAQPLSDMQKHPAVYESRGGGASPSTYDPTTAAPSPGSPFRALKVGGGGAPGGYDPVPQRDAAAGAGGGPPGYGSHFHGGYAHELPTARSSEEVHMAELA